MNGWQRILRQVKIHGVRRPDRTGTGTLALFGQQVAFNNSGDVFPAVTTKRLAFKSVCAELTCFVRGYSTLEEFHSVGCNIWDGNAEQTSGSRFVPAHEGDLGRIYGVQWRDWTSVRHNEADVPSAVYTDQLKNLVEGLVRDPYGRRHVVSAWNPGELDAVCLPACHMFFQCFVADGRLDLLVYMRSVDLFLGLPFDVASYAVLQRLIAQQVGLRSGSLVFSLGDAHIYLNHLEQVEEVLRRHPLPAPRLELNPFVDVFDFTPDDAALVGYEHCGALAAPLNT